MSWGFYTPLKPAAEAALSQVRLPEVLHPSSLSLIHLPLSLSIYPAFKQKSKQAIVLFLLNGGSIRSAVLSFHSYPLIAFNQPFFMKEEKEHLPSS